MLTVLLGADKNYPICQKKKKKNTNPAISYLTPTCILLVVRTALPASPPHITHLPVPADYTHLSLRLAYLHLIAPKAHTPFLYDQKHRLEVIICITHKSGPTRHAKGRKLFGEKASRFFIGLNSSPCRSHTGGFVQTLL